MLLSLLLASSPAPPVQIQTCDTITAVVRREQGPPSGSLAIRHLGAPLIGGGAPLVVLEGGAPGSAAVLGIGVDSIAIPFGAATLFTAPLQLVPFVLDGSGAATLDLGPGLVFGDGLCGQLLAVQAGVIDASAPEGVLVSDGLEFTVGAAFDAPTFGGARIDTGDAPTDIVITDLDGDGIRDLVVANGNGDSVSTLLGDGRGGFSGATEVFVGNSPTQLAVTDLDGDGAPDVAVSFTAEEFGVLLLGNGDGTLAAPTTLATEGRGGVDAADVTGDGLVDLVFSVRADNDGVRVFTGDGAGGFTPSGLIPIGLPVPDEVALGDLNGDGSPDLVVAAAGGSGALFSVLLNDGAGNFAEVLGSPFDSVSSSIGGLEIVDVDSDGNLDVLVSGTFSDDVTAHLGDGAGAFTSSVTTDLVQGTVVPGEGISGTNLASEDFDGDGVLDIAVSSLISDTVRLHRGLGDGSFLFERSYGVGNVPGAVATGDIDGDGLADLLVGGLSSDDLTLMFGRDGFDLDGSTFSVGFGGSIDLLQAELTGDGAADVLTADLQSGRLTIHGGDGQGGLSVATSFTVGGGPAAVRAVDVDQDEELDLLFVDLFGDRFGLLRGLGDGAYGAPEFVALPVGSGPIGLDLGDLDDDGDLDVAVVNSGSGDLIFFSNDGAGGFAAAGLLDLGTSNDPRDVGVRDLDGNGTADLVVVANPSSSAAAELLVFSNLGGGQFVEAFASTALSSPEDLEIGDLNGDGRPDVAIADGTQAAVLFGGATIGAGTLTTFPAGLNAFGVDVADLDGDGRDDLGVLGATNDVSVRLFLNRGDGGLELDPAGEFSVHTIGTNITSGVPTAVAIGDLDGDQRPDLTVSASASSAGGGVSVTLNRTPSPLDS